jgi:hypothetical protein
MHELSFGNHMRQDRRAAERINDLITTIEELAALMPSGTIGADLQLRVDRARRFKSIRIVDIDVQGAQDPQGLPGDQHPSDGQFGLRDFSRDTVRRRRDEGYRIARTRLSPVFADFGLTTSARRSDHAPRG